MKRIGLIILCLSTLSGYAIGQDTVRMTLDSCLRYAHHHNAQVQNALLGEESANVALTGAKLRFLPTLSATASQGWNYGDASNSSTQYGLNGNLVLFSGLSNLRNLHQSQVAAKQSSLQSQQIANSIDLQVVQAYLTMLMNQERLSYQQEVLETTREQQAEGEVKYQVGRILESDYQLLCANLSSAESEVENTRLTIEDNRSSLSTLIGLDAETVLAVVSTSDSLRADQREVLSLDSLMAQAQRIMPDWEISRLSVESARIGVDLSQSAFLPTLNLNAGYGGQWGNAAAAIEGNSAKSFAQSSSVSLGLNIPILNRGSSITQLKQSKIALQQAEIEHQQTLLDLSNQLRNIHLSTQQALNRYRASEALSEAYRQSYEVYILKYGQGAITTVEMLQQQDKYLSALNDYLQNKYSYLLTEKQIDIYTGQEISL